MGSTAGDDASTNYVVAVKRECRDAVAPDWADRIGELDGVDVRPSSPGASRLIVSATAEGARRLYDQIGDTCHIEPLVEYHTQEPSRLDDRWR